MDDEERQQAYALLAYALIQALDIIALDMEQDFDPLNIEWVDFNQPRWMQ